MLTSMIWAPLSTWSRATSSAVSSAPSRISFLNRADPVTLVRSPTLTNSEDSSIAIGSSPARRSLWSGSGSARGLTPATAAPIAAM